MKSLALLSIAALALSAQQPQIENAQVTKRASSGALAAQFTQLGSGPFWVGYSEPIAPNRHNTMCGSNQSTDAPLRLEGQTAIVILARFTAGQMDELRITSPDCRLDAGGLPFFWFDNVPATESIAWLKTKVSPTKPDSAIMAISMHTGPAADAALQELTAPSQPDRIREKAAFWIGNSRGGQGVQTLNRMLASDPSEKVREQVVFALSQSKDPSAMESVIKTARSDNDPKIRSKALFWLAQKAANRQAVDTIRASVNSDPERSVKEQAVFALSQLKNNEGISALIDVAKNHADPAVRKKAMFWLGQSNDARAIDFFAQVLKQ